MALPAPTRKTVGLRLQGEPEDTALLDEALHWCRVYAELVVGFRSIAAGEASTRRRARNLQVRRLQERFAFWDRRRRELTLPFEQAISQKSADSTAWRRSVDPFTQPLRKADPIAERGP
ncbi:MAG: hypothetical protein E6I56_07625 [Chloroflexi bacterium]|nr:MAG: hypothetical protein E6I56_07625 [Chloroflexota bacterium]